MKSLVACLIMLSCLPAFAGPRVDIVIGEKAPALERLAADELSSQLERVYEADVKIGSTVPADAPHVIFVGSPDTNASMKPFAAQWPSGEKKLTDQGHLLRSVTHRDHPALVIGGGSPVATYWAVSEFGHRLGIRSLLFGDLDPVAAPPFRLDGIDVVMDPALRVRGWNFANAFPLGCGAWGLDEYQRVLKQLAKLKFNRVRLVVAASEPFVHFEYSGVKRQTAVLWNGFQYPVSGDTSGRKVFGGAKFFENPGFVGATTYEQRIAAGTKLLNGVITAAHSMGMNVSFELPIGECPKEFAAAFPNPKEVGLVEGRTMSIDLDSMSRNQQLAGLVKAQLRGYLGTYPELDGVETSVLVNGNAELAALRRLFAEPGLLRREDGRDVEVRHWVLREKHLVAAPFESKKGAVAASEGIDLFFLNHPASVLPMLQLSGLREHLSVIRPMGREGFLATAGGFGDLDLSAYWLSRASFDDALTLEQACEQLVEPICGDGVNERVVKALRFIEQADQLLLSNDSFFAIPEQGVFEKIGSDHKLPPWWGEVRDNYLNAMNEMYRANTRAREGGRAFTLYLARRFEFAFEYMNCIEAIRNAVFAERKKDTATQIAELEKAIEALNNGLNAMAAVARSNSDRGLIAVLNEYGYRPLKKKLAEAEEAAK